MKTEEPSVFQIFPKSCTTSCVTAMCHRYVTSLIFTSHLLPITSKQLAKFCLNKFLISKVILEKYVFEASVV